MKIAIIGATGLVGQPLTQEANDREHKVSTYTRSGSLSGSHPIQLQDTQAITEIINNHDATVITVASRDDYNGAINAHKALIDAKPTGRLIVVGGAGSLNTESGLLFENPNFPAEYLPEAQAFYAIYQAYLAATDLNWTMVAPSPLIAPGVRTGQYRTELDTIAGDFVSSQDFAVAIVDEIENPAFSGKRFTVASTTDNARG
ncbi:NADH-flavin reductase [Corynebacterium kutscheri]|uniref:NADH-flavin reductase n=1 Tax=Corynebacterium kutscheri TaxID=35755 RepID=A0A0F6TDM9_9CORY|nr:NAD(P)H-binding protein [Corynebacterium kutscheri]AKE41409.1 putative NADH-flavin reductase [Corynebacterium kutscheri]VEH08686.1 NADH-flavin reductase [Corynebacterium kutscheri]VEH09733.1 NADH-flavin reductase [Corynebacterium kutscheri]VEH79816.1 NADH-flavin reductase [Corynebacterium kutscheri]